MDRTIVARKLIRLAKSLCAKTLSCPFCGKAPREYSIGRDVAKKMCMCKTGDCAIFDVPVSETQWQKRA